MTVIQRNFEQNDVGSFYVIEIEMLATKIISYL
jgi:hypothetical protein